MENYLILRFHKATKLNFQFVFFQFWCKFEDWRLNLNCKLIEYVCCCCCQFSSKFVCNKQGQMPQRWDLKNEVDDVLNHYTQFSSVQVQPRLEKFLCPSSTTNECHCHNSFIIITSCYCFNSCTVWIWLKSVSKQKQNRSEFYKY